MRSRDIHLRTISKEIPQPSITNISSKIASLKFQSNHPRVSELNHYYSLEDQVPHIISSLPAPGHPGNLVFGKIGEHCVVCMQGRIHLFEGYPARRVGHDDVIKWKHIPGYWPFVRGIHWSPVNSPHKGQWRGALIFSLIWDWINGWVNNREAGDLRRHRAHYDVSGIFPIEKKWTTFPKRQFQMHVCQWKS